MVAAFNKKCFHLVRIVPVSCNCCIRSELCQIRWLQVDKYFEQLPAPHLLFPRCCYRFLFHFRRELYCYPRRTKVMSHILAHRLSDRFEYSGRSNGRLLMLKIRRNMLLSFAFVHKDSVPFFQGVQSACFVNTCNGLSVRHFHRNSSLQGPIVS